MCGKDLKLDPKQQAISVKGFFTGTPQSKYGWYLWLCEEHVNDLIATLELDMKKLDALRASDAENDLEREAE